MTNCLGASGDVFYQACVGGVCEGTADCPYGASPCGGSCVRVDFDPANCGACGNSCPGGDLCQQGQCVPFANVVIATTGLAASSSGLLTAHQAGDVFVDGARVLYTDLGANTVNSIPLAGGTPKTLGTNQAAPVRVVGDGVYAYWSSYLGGAILRAPEDGTGNVEVVAPASQPWALAVDAVYVYWVDTQTGRFLRAPKAPADGGATIALGGQPDTSNSEMYFDSTGALFAGCSTGPCKTTSPSGPFVTISIPPTNQCKAPFTFQGGVGWCTYTGSVTWFETSDVTQTWVQNDPQEMDRLTPFPEAIPAPASCAILATQTSGWSQGVVVSPLPAPAPAAVVFPIALSQGSWSSSRLSRSGTSLAFSFGNAGTSSGGVAVVQVPSK
jgi:hypothetical protein